MLLYIDSKEEIKDEFDHLDSILQAYISKTMHYTIGYFGHEGFLCVKETEDGVRLIGGVPNKHPLNASQKVELTDYLLFTDPTRKDRVITADTEELNIIKRDQREKVSFDVVIYHMVPDDVDSLQFFSVVIKNRSIIREYDEELPAIYYDALRHESYYKIDKYVLTMDEQDKIFVSKRVLDIDTSTQYDLVTPQQDYVLCTIKTVGSKTVTVHYNKDHKLELSEFMNKTVDTNDIIPISRHI